MPVSMAAKSWKPGHFRKNERPLTREEKKRYLIINSPCKLYYNQLSHSNVYFYKPVVTFAWLWFLLTRFGCLQRK